MFSSRREFMKKAALATAAVGVGASLISADYKPNDPDLEFLYNLKNDEQKRKQQADKTHFKDDKYRIIPKGEGLPITGTFLDEITWDIPSQNWGRGGLGSRLCSHETCRHRHRGDDPRSFWSLYDFPLGDAHEIRRRLHVRTGSGYAWNVSEFG